MPLFIERNMKNWIHAAMVAAFSVAMEYNPDTVSPPRVLKKVSPLMISASIIESIQESCLLEQTNPQFAE